MDQESTVAEFDVLQGALDAGDGEKVGPVRPSTCATEHVRDRARARPSTCATEHQRDLAGGGGGGGGGPPPTIPWLARFSAVEYLLCTRFALA